MEKNSQPKNTPRTRNIVNPSNAEAPPPPPLPKHKGAKIFENHVNLIVLVFISLKVALTEY